jgi:hypothetical protein
MNPSDPAASEVQRQIMESRIGLMLFFITLLYCVAICIFDSKKNKRFVLSKNLLRHLLDGLTLSTGVTILLAIFDTSVFSIVAANAVYITVTSLTCIFGPLINLAERYGRVIDE